MSQISAYLTFDGNCADAMRFYERTLGGKLGMMTHAQSPMADQVPPGNGERIMHACLTLDDGMLMASDAMVGQPFEGMKGFSLALSYASAAEATRIAQALAEGGEVIMPVQETFWAEAFAMVLDRFGTRWIVNGAMRAG